MKWSRIMINNTYNENIYTALGRFNHPKTHERGKTKHQKTRPSLSDSSKMQEVFLNHCRKNDICVKIQCKNDQEYEGYILGFDQEIIILYAQGFQNLHYKESIVRIVPQEELDFFFNDNWKEYRNEKIIN